MTDDIKILSIPEEIKADQEQRPMVYSLYAYIEPRDRKDNALFWFISEDELPVHVYEEYKTFQEQWPGAAWPGTFSYHGHYARAYLGHDVRITYGELKAPIESNFWEACQGWKEISQERRDVFEKAVKELLNGASGSSWYDSMQHG